MSKRSQRLRREEDLREQRIVSGSFGVTLLIWAMLAVGASLPQLSTTTAHLIVATTYAVAAIWTYRCVRYLLNDRSLALQISGLPGVFMIIHLLCALLVRPTGDRLSVIIPELLAFTLMAGCALASMLFNGLKHDRR